MREWQCTQWNMLLVHVFFLFTLLWKTEGRNKQFIPNKSKMLRRKEIQNWNFFHGLLCGVTWCIFVKTEAINFQRTSHQSEARLFYMPSHLCTRGTKLGSKTLRGDGAGILWGCKYQSLVFVGPSFFTLKCRYGHM